ncbi:MAG TPA: tRNA glutamyl-Q(34) synthetase GluQRS [Opitutales bacterium]|jgi:glutamyl/glutaminyl-tRNA synthetase|nr:tRNA glutamyl-Q(34) synthetase GluQRS [Opitutales bacterium]
MYRGRLAPTPTGRLHLGHARTFWLAAARARAAGPEARLVLRIEDLDTPRCKPEFTAAILDDLRWLRLRWDEGPDVGGPHAPYEQSRRREVYLAAWRQLRDGGFIYPCARSRADVARAATAPHADEEDAEPLYPPECRPPPGTGCDAPVPVTPSLSVNWRFRVPDGEAITFHDALRGPQSFIAGKDFGDFLVWRRDDVPAYELAVVADDHAMHITEVVRGADLLKSTARQILIYRALGWPHPAWCHAPLMLDENGKRLAKRTAAFSLATFRAQDADPQKIIEHFSNVIR